MKPAKKAVLPAIILFMLLLMESATNAHEPSFYRDMFEEHGAVMLLIDLETGTIDYANKAAAAYYGYSVEQLQAMNINEINTLSPEKIEQERRAAAREERNYFIFPHRLASGEVRTVEVYSWPFILDEETMLFSIIQDITDQLLAEKALQNRTILFFVIMILAILLQLIIILNLIKANGKWKNSQNALQESEEKYRSIFEGAPLGILHFDQEGIITACNDNFVQIIGSSRSALIGLRMFKLPNKEIVASVVSVLKGQAKLYEGIYHSTTAPKNTPVRAFFAPLFAEDGQPRGGIGMVEDITQRKLAETELKESEDRFRMLVELAPDAIFVQTEGKFAYVNAATLDLFGAESKEQLLGTPVMERFHPDFHPAISIRIHLLNKEKKSVTALEEVHLKLDGTPIEVEVSAVPLRYQSTDGALVYVRDISERKEAERRKLNKISKLQNQQKLEAIGGLASGIAHEINNPINGIINYGQLILDNEKSDSPNAQYAREIIEESERVSDIVRNLLQFSRQEKQSHSPAEIPDIITKTLSLIQTIIIKDKITLEVNIPAGLPRIKCRSQQIQQILMNLVLNAKDALNDKYTGYHEDKVIRINCHTFIQSDLRWIRTTVEDHGPGIPRMHHKKLFEPFFTTKPRDKGTGLGLAISYGIAKEHQGTLTFETKFGEWTRFHLDLPVDNGYNNGCK